MHRVKKLFSLAFRVSFFLARFLSPSLLLYVSASLLSSFSFHLIHLPQFLSLLSLPLSATSPALPNEPTERICFTETPRPRHTAHAGAPVSRRGVARGVTGAARRAYLFTVSEEMAALPRASFAALTRRVSPATL